jgi:hypothetical protein
MNLAQSALFQELSPRATEAFAELLHPKLQNIFSINSQSVTLILTDNYILLNDNPNQQVPSFYLPLTFDVKF